MEDLDDWEMEEYNPILQSEETKRRLEERKKVEESDLAISKGLFGNEIEIAEPKQIVPISPDVQKPKVSNRVENEMKLKAKSKILKEKKAKQARHDEIYGECTEDEYSHYEKKFY